MVFKVVKFYVRQLLLKHRFAHNNVIERNVIFSKDTIIEGNAFIGANTILGPNVRVGKNVRIGKNAMLSNIVIGDHSCIESEVICTGYGKGKIIIGKHSYIGIRTILDWSDNITIGDFVHIAGPSTGLWTHSTAKMCLYGVPLSRLDDKNYRPTAPIVIENNVYIGGNCTIYPGVTIHHHSVVAPNSAVTKDVPPYTMVGGVPARVIKHIHIDNK